MVKFFVSTAVLILANGIGLLIAAILLPGFRIDPLAFVVAVLIFSIVQAVLGPFITKVALKNFPQALGGIALVIVFVGLFVTDVLMPSMEIGGISNSLAATLLVWLGSLIATILLPIYVFKQVAEKAHEN